MLNCERRGDYYEFEGVEARLVARVLNVTVTQRGGLDCVGLPYHSFEKYRNILSAEGYQVHVKEATDATQ